MVLAALLSRARGEGTMIVLIGQEHPIEQMQACATVLASYGLGDQRRGTLAVIGPTRMDYPLTISAVTMIGALRPNTCAVVMTTSDSAQIFFMPSRCFWSCSSVRGLA